MSSSTACDIWRHALAKARNARQATNTLAVEPTTIPVVSSTPVFTGIIEPVPPHHPVPTSAPASSRCPESDKEFTLGELIGALVLDAAQKSGRPRVLSAEDKDNLVKFVKTDFTTRRMTLGDIRREAGLSQVSDSTVYRALRERGIGAYQELFKFILNEESRKKRLVS